MPYDVKERELVAQLSIESRSYDVSADLDSSALAEAILRASDDLTAERDRTAAVVAAKRRDAASAFALLRSWVAGPSRSWELLSA